MTDTVNAATRPQLANLSLPLNKHVRKAPAGKYGDYVPHYVITQALLAYLGSFDWELVEIIRGDASGTLNNELVFVPNVIVGVVYRLTCEVDGRSTVIEEIGACSNPHLDITDAERLKLAVSDAMKRCAMRVGLGLHLWCTSADEYFLSRWMHRTIEDKSHEGHQTPVVGVEEQGETV